MAFTASHIHLSFLSFFTVILLVQAKLNLYSPDHSALLLVQKGLGIPAHRNALENACNSVGISCEKRLTNNSYVLRVTRVVFKSYGLKGTLSPAIGRLSELKELSLQNNKLFDRIPTEIVDSRKLEILNLQNNQFSGKVPTELSSLVRLRTLDLGSNELSGNLNFLKYFPNLEKLSLADNMFTGRIPQSLKSFRNLRFLNISGNSFLEGTVPVKKDKHNKIRRKVGLWILGFFAGVFAGGLSALVFSVLFKVLMFLIRGIRNDSGITIFSPLIKKAEHLAFLENEDGLESLELIGQGGCGKVYKAALPGSDGKIIAVKKIIQPPRDAAELKDTLQQVREGTRELDWSARHRIAMGIAAGLEYLHINHTQRIIHRDLKPGNVLLDDDMEARIADFGLAKAVPDAHTHITTSNVAGTIGYIAPEYHQTLKFTDKCDIYSFGVLLGVLVMGKLPSDEFFQNTSEMSLVKWMRNVMTSEDPNRAIDPKLMGNGNEDQILLVLKIACFCTLENPKERPNSKDVRCMLMQIKH